MPGAPCPYCGAILNPPPKRKKACPECGNSILVRQGRLLTEEQVEEEAAISRFECEGLTRKDFQETRDQLSKRFGMRASVRDTVWAMYNAQAAQGDAHHRSRCYLRMAEILEAEGKSPDDLYAEARRADWERHRAELQEMTRAGSRTVTVRTCNDKGVCPACKALAGKTLPIADALAGKLIPHVCQNNHCRCWYAQGPEPRHASRSVRPAKKKGCLGLGMLALAAVILTTAVTFISHYPSVVPPDTQHGPEFAPERELGVIGANWGPFPHKACV